MSAKKTINPDMPSRSNSQNITAEKIKKFLPKGVSHQVSDEIVDMVNNMEDDTGLLQDYMEESFMSHFGVLKGTKTKLHDYVNAIKYCNLKQHMTNDEAWAIVFPERYDKLIEEGRFNSSHVSMFNSREVVVKIDTQMYISASIQYAPYRHAAIKKQFDLMNGKGANSDDYVSPTVQHLAAVKLYDITEIAEDKAINIKIDQSDAQIEQARELNQSIAAIVENQKAAFIRGDDVAKLQKIHVNVIDAEVDEEEESDEYDDEKVDAQNMRD